MVTAGYQNAISIFNISSEYLDYSLVGKLIGHNAMVTAICPVEGSPMVVSADDLGVIKGFFDIELYVFY